MENFNNNLMIAVSATTNHGKTESTRLLIDLLYHELVNNRSGWDAKIYERSKEDYLDYVPGGHYTKDRFVVFIHDTEVKIAVITGGDVWDKYNEPDRVAIYWQKLLETEDLNAGSMKLKDSLEVVVGCCHPNNKVKKKLVEIASDSGYEMMETSPYYQVPEVTSAQPKLSLRTWDSLFAKHLLDIILARMVAENSQKS